MHRTGKAWGRNIAVLRGTSQFRIGDIFRKGGSAARRTLAPAPSDRQRRRRWSATVVADVMPVKPHEHLLPMCFVCDPARAQGDGLRIVAGRLASILGCFGRARGGLDT
jgi:hypothetical protein